MLAPESLKRVHPLGKSPVIEDNGLILAESGAILEYLQETYDAESQLKPLDPAHKVQYRFWLHYAEGSLMPLLLMKLVFSSLGKPPVPFGIRTLGKALGQGVQKPISIPSSKPTRVLLNLTAENSWFAGDTQHGRYSDEFPDFCPAGTRRCRGSSAHPCPEEKVENRPARQRTPEQGGPLTILGEA